MKRLVKLGFGILLCFSMWSIALISYADQTSPVGYWKQVSDEPGMEGQVRSIIKISQSNGQLIGTIEKTFTVNGVVPSSTCANCPGNFNNKPIVGLTIMWGLKQVDNNNWDDGEILDPKSGKIYSCKITLANGGTQLNVRGYLGVSLLGRTQVWQRATPADIAKLLK